MDSLISQRDREWFGRGIVGMAMTLVPGSLQNAAGVTEWAIKISAVWTTGTKKVSSDRFKP